MVGGLIQPTIVYASLLGTAGPQPGGALSRARRKSRWLRSDRRNRAGGTAGGGLMPWLATSAGSVWPRVNACVVLAYEVAIR